MKAFVRLAASITLLTSPVGAALAVDHIAESDQPTAAIAVVSGYLAGWIITFVWQRTAGLRRRWSSQRAESALDGVKPLELPPPPPVLVGRDEEVKTLLGYLTEEAPHTRRRLTVICGPPGIGKTALAIHIAHRVSSHYPDGQLYADLGGVRRQPYELVHNTLGEFLKALSRPGETVPTDREERVRRFRQLTIDRRVLIILDDVGTDQIENLLPASSQCAAIITSRLRLESLGTGLSVRLGELSEQSALDLLGTIVGRKRVGENKKAARELARSCQYHPLALHLAGASLVNRPASDLGMVLFRARQAAAGRAVDESSTSTMPRSEFRNALDFSYLLLPEENREALLRLGLLDRQFEPWMLSTALGIAEPQAWRMADRLASAQLVERTSADSAGVPVYETVEHVQAYAKSRAVVELPAKDRDGLTELVRREGNRRRPPDPSDVLRRQVYQFLDEGELSKAHGAARDALAVAREKNNRDAIGLALVALAELRAEVGGTDDVVDLAEQAWKLDLPATRARVSRVMGHVQRRVRRLPEAELNLRRALRYSRQAEDQAEQIRTLAELARVAALTKTPLDGLRYTEQALAMCDARKRGAAPHRPRVLLAQGIVYSRAQDWDAALASLDAASSAAGPRFRLWDAWIGYRRSQVYFQAGNLTAAKENAYAVLDRFVTLRHRYGAAHCRMLLGRIHQKAGETAAAQQAYEEALETFRNCGDRWIEARTAMSLARLYVEITRRPADLDSSHAALDIAAEMAQRARALLAGNREAWWVSLAIVRRRLALKWERLARRLWPQPAGTAGVHVRG